MGKKEAKIIKNLCLGIPARQASAPTSAKSAVYTQNRDISDSR